jgi:hypothetical protein
MSFRERGWRWQIPIYKDNSRVIVLMSSVQSGKTDWLIVRAITHCKDGNTVLFSWPTEEMRNKQVQNRIDKVIKTVPYYRDAAKRIDSVGNKQLWSGSIVFVGSNSIVNFTGITAQVFIADEVDFSNMDNIRYGIDRLAAAKRLKRKPFEYYVSNPTLSGHGIHRKYDESDKKTWQIKCEHCNKHQEIDWFRNVVRQTDNNLYELRDKNFVVGQAQASNSVASVPSFKRGETAEDVKVFCRYCDRPIDRLSEGEWIAEFKDKKVSGYHISKLFTDQISIAELWGRFQYAVQNPGELQHFYNSELGLPYAGGDNKLDFASLDKLKANYRMPTTADHCIAGIDVGKYFHTQVWNLKDSKARTVFVGALPSPEHVVETLKRFGVYRYAIDAMPETHLARKVIELMPGGMLVWIQGESSKGTMGKFDEVSVNRTEFIDAMVANYHAGLIELPIDWATLDNGDFLAQMTASVRVIKEKTVSGVKRPVYVWDEGSKPDHYFLAAALVNKVAESVGFCGEQWGGLWG